MKENEEARHLLTKLAELVDIVVTHAQLKEYKL